MKITDIILESQITGSTIDRLVSIAKDQKIDISLRQDVFNILTQLEEKRQQDLAEDTKSPEQLIANIESDEDYYQRLLNSDPRLKAIAEKKIKEAETNAFTAGAGLSNDPFEGLTKQIAEAVRNLTQLPDMYKNSVAKECVHLVVEGLPQNTVIKFLHECAKPNRIIDMPTIISKSSRGRLPIPHQFMSIAEHIARLTPGSSSAAMGKGELLLVLAGKATTKATPGDINVAGTPIEVKASDISGSDVTDFILGKMDTKSARTILVSAINKVAGKQVYLDNEAKSTAQNKQGETITGISGIGQTTLPKLNQYFSKMGKDKVAEMFSKMLHIAVGVGFDQQITAVVDAISPNGTMNPAEIIPPLKKLVFDVYQTKNKHAGLLSLNLSNFTYTMSRNGDDFANSQEIVVTKIFDFRPRTSSILSIKRK